jgi:hypothetical protein
MWITALFSLNSTAWQLYKWIDSLRVTFVANMDKFSDFLKMQDAHNLSALIQAGYPQGFSAYSMPVTLLIF